MGNAVFPSLPGLKFDDTKAPSFNTEVHRSVSGSEARASLMAYPLWEYSLPFEFLRDGNAGNELRTLGGFFLERRGRFDSFLYTDPSDNTVVGQNFGTGDGATVSFQLVRAFGSFIEPVQNLNGTPVIYKNGLVQTSGFTISATGLVTFSPAPALGTVLTWDGSYYFRCRFLDDVSKFKQFMRNLWDLKELNFVGSPMNKL